MNFIQNKAAKYPPIRTIEIPKSLLAVKKILNLLILIIAALLFFLPLFKLAYHKAYKVVPVSLCIAVLNGDIKILVHKILLKTCW